MCILTPFIPQSFACATGMTPKHNANLQCRRTHPHTHTFPGGDESCQELAEVGSWVCILLSQRKSFELGGRAPVLDVGLFQGVGVSLQESYSIQTKTRTAADDAKMMMSKKMMLKLTVRLEKELPVRDLSLRAARDFYLQRKRRQSAGPPWGAGRRKGARNSSYTGLPARHTHTALQSSKTHREKSEKHTEKV